MNRVGIIFKSLRITILFVLISLTSLFNSNSSWSNESQIKATSATPVSTGVIFALVNNKPVYIKLAGIYLPTASIADDKEFEKWGLNPSEYRELVRKSIARLYGLVIGKTVSIIPQDDHSSDKSRVMAQIGVMAGKALVDSLPLNKYDPSGISNGLLNAGFDQVEHNVKKPESIAAYVKVDYIGYVEIDGQDLAKTLLEEGLACPCMDCEHPRVAEYAMAYAAASSRSYAEKAGLNPALNETTVINSPEIDDDKLAIDILKGSQPCPCNEIEPIVLSYRQLTEHNPGSVLSYAPAIRKLIRSCRYIVVAKGILEENKPFPSCGNMTNAYRATVAGYARHVQGGSMPLDQKNNIIFMVAGMIADCNQ